MFWFYLAMGFPDAGPIIYYLTYKVVIVVFDNNWLKEKDVTQDMVYYHPLFNYVIHHSVHNYVCGSSSNKGVIIGCPT